MCNRIILTFFLLAILAALFGCDDSESGGVKTCRIKEIYFDTPTKYSFNFHYNSDGTLNSIKSPNVTMNYVYESGKLKTITSNSSNSVESITYEYPTDNLTTWASSSFNNRIYKLYHTGDKVDSLIVIDSPAGQPSLEFRSYPTYNGNNVQQINSGGGCCEYNVNDIEYDNGKNPASLLRKSVRAFTGQDIMGYTFFRFSPEQLSESNPTRYQMSGSYNAAIENEYTYSTQGSYPLTFTQYNNGTLNGSAFNFVYENCD